MHAAKGAHSLVVPRRKMGRQWLAEKYFRGARIFVDPETDRQGRKQSGQKKKKKNNRWATDVGPVSRP